MLMKPPLGLFVTGTDTAVGKTYVAALIARSLASSGKRVGVYKPTASGARRLGGRLVAEDAVALWEAAGKPGTLQEVCPQVFEAPLAPHLAARLEGKQLDGSLLRTGIESWYGRSDIVIVEGAGGLMSPIGENDYAADLACDFDYPLLVVAPNVLGVINQTIQTLITAATYRGGLHVAGVILNDVQRTLHDASRLSNLKELTERCEPPVLAHVGWQMQTFEPEVDWFALAANART